MLVVFEDVLVFWTWAARSHLLFSNNRNSVVSSGFMCWMCELTVVLDERSVRITLRFSILVIR